MKLTIDRENNVAYLTLAVEEDRVEGIVGTSVMLRDNQGRDQNIVVDFDRDGGVFGIEFLNANTQLRPRVDREGS